MCVCVLLIYNNYMKDTVLRVRVRFRASKSRNPFSVSRTAQSREFRWFQLTAVKLVLFYSTVLFIVATVAIVLLPPGHTVV